MKYLSIVFVLLLSAIQHSSEGKRFEIAELGFSFEEPGWYETKNEKFTTTLKKYDWNVRNAISSVNSGSIEVIRYHKDSVNKDKKVYLHISLGGLHKNLQDFDKLLEFDRSTKINAPNFKMLQPYTAIDLNGKKAIISFMSYTQLDGKDGSYKIYAKSVSIFMGTYTYNISMYVKDIKDIAVFDSLIKTVTITK